VEGNCLPRDTLRRIERTNVRNTQAISVLHPLRQAYGSLVPKGQHLPLLQMQSPKEGFVSVLSVSIFAIIVAAIEVTYIVQGISKNGRKP
jgi:hypothetical protein